MKSTKKITIAIYSGEIPSTTFIEHLIKVVAAQGFEVWVFGKIKSKVSYQETGIRVVFNSVGMIGTVEVVARMVMLRIKNPDRYFKLKQQVGSAFSTKIRFRQWQKYLPVVLHLPDIFHLQWAKAAEEWIFLKHCFGVRLVLSLRGSHINHSPLADIALAESYRKHLPQYDAFHAVCRAIAKKAEEFGVTGDKTHIIYSGIKSVPLSLRSNHSSNTEVRLLTVGRFHWVKGYHYLLDAISLLRQRKVSVKLTLIAQGKMPEEILFQLNDLRLNMEVRWIQGLPHEAVLREMENHDLLVLPSVEEGIANVILEAMNVGLPVISTKCGGMGEVIEHGVNGFLVPVRNTGALADMVLHFTECSSDEIDLIRINAHQTVREKFSDAISGKKFTELYSSLACE